MLWGPAGRASTGSRIGEEGSYSSDLVTKVQQEGRDLPVSSDSQ